MSGPDPKPESIQNPDAEGGESMQLLNRYREGDEMAAAQIVDRYAQRLLALAAARISPGMARRVEAEDVVQSVYKSFFKRAGEGKFDVGEQGQLWGLLAAITVNKVRSKARFHSAAKRDASNEASVNSSVAGYRVFLEDFARTPSAVDAAIVEEQCALVMDSLSDAGKVVFQMHLEDKSVDEIASRIRRSPRTVRRELESIRSRLEEILVS